MEAFDLFDSFSDIAEQGETYTGEDGLKWCAKHHKPVQVKVDIFGVEKIQNCVCADCREEEKAFRAEEQSREYRESRRIRCFGEKKMINWTFAKDDNARPEITRALKKYAAEFAEYKQDGKGLVLYGNVGTGKTFMAACVANAVIDAGFSAYATDIHTLTDKMQEDYSARLRVMKQLATYDLLVLDDLGTERETPYVQEIVYNVIDARYQDGLPLIVTTNLTGKDFENPKTLIYERVFDRLMERGIFVKMDGESRRRKLFKNTQNQLRTELGL